ALPPTARYDFPAALPLPDCATPDTAHSACHSERPARSAPAPWQSSTRTAAPAPWPAPPAMPATPCRCSALSGISAAGRRDRSCLLLPPANVELILVSTAL